MYINILGLLAGAAGILYGTESHHQLYFVIGGILFAVSLVRQFRAIANVEAVGRTKIKETDSKLRDDLLACHKLAIAKLGTADDATQTKVIELLVEAGKHLGDPYTKSRIIYTADYFINWNNEGIALVAQAKKLIDDSQPKA